MWEIILPIQAQTSSMYSIMWSHYVSPKTPKSFHSPLWKLECPLVIQRKYKTLNTTEERKKNKFDRNPEMRIANVSFLLKVGFPLVSWSSGIHEALASETCRKKTIFSIFLHYKCKMIKICPQLVSPPSRKWIDWHPRETRITKSEDKPSSSSSFRQRRLQRFCYDYQPRPPLPP